MKQYNRDRRLTVQYLGEVQLPSGEIVEDWLPYGTFWAHVEQLRGRELFAAQQVKAENQTRAIMLYNSLTKGISQKMQAVVDGKTYGITSVIDMYGNREYIELMMVDDHG